MNRQKTAYNIIAIHVMIFLMWILAVMPETAFGQRLVFNKITYDDGLSHNTVLSVMRDKSGFLWIGTRDGLNRYDGYRIKTYRRDTSNKSSISTNNYIYALAQNDTDGTMWVGTQDGLNIYHPSTDNFTRVPPPDHWKNGHFAVLSIHLEHSKAYLGTNRGLVRISDINKPEAVTPLVLHESEIFSIYRGNNNMLLGTNKGAYVFKGLNSVRKLSWPNVGDHAVRDIKKIAQNRIWITYDGSGIVEVDTQYRFVKHYNSSNGLASDFVRVLSLDQQKDIWIGTMDGVNIYHPKTHTFEKYNLDYTDPFSLSDNSIRVLYPDYQGTMWVGTNFGGLNYYNKSLYNFRLEVADGRPGSISGHLVSAIAVEEDGTLWVGTERDGLNLRRAGSDQFEKLPLRSHTVKTICITPKYILVGTYDAGLLRINRKDHSDRKYYNNEGENGIRLSQNYIGYISVDHQGNIWVGTGNSGIDIVSPNFTQTWQLNNHSTPKLTNNYIKAILCTQSGDIWVATASGLYCLDENKQVTKVYNSVNSALRSDYINAIYEDSRQDIWVGTQEGGLYRIDNSRQNFEIIPLFADRSTYHVLAIHGGTGDNLVLSTSHGIVIYNTKTKRATNRSILDGLPTNQLLSNAIAKYNKHIYIGSSKGLIDLDLSSQAFNSLPPKIVWSEIEIRGLDEQHIPEVLQKTNIDRLKKISLKHNQNTFTIYFGSDNLINTPKNRFAYKIDGANEEWIYSHNPYVSFTNLPIGTYHLHVKTANNDDIWSTDERVLQIEILPPFYLSWWAYLIYFSIVATVLYLFTKYALEKKQLQAKLFYEERHHRDQELLMQSKLDFFTKISHEIRTPLTLIAAPIDKLRRTVDLDDTASQQLSLVSRNISRLLKLMEELLTFRKLDNSAIELKKQSIDSETFFQDMYELFIPIAESQNVQFTIDNEFQGRFTADSVYLEKALVNLLANAFKFTNPTQGKVALLIKAKENEIQIEVSDNGAGIQGKDKSKIFENFYQSDNQGLHQGWGIGLALVKEVALLHKGHISVRSLEEGVRPGFATSFHLQLPLIANDYEEAVAESRRPPMVIDDMGTSHPTPPSSKPSTAYKILVVEDNIELRDFLCKHLQEKYDVLFAEDGDQGFKLAKVEVPDIILTDVAMPKMDGFEMVQLLKSEQDTSHIPVVMLTAKGEFSEMLAGYQSGALHYIAKPFSLQLLDVQLNNILSLIERMKSAGRDFLLKGIVPTDLPHGDKTYLEKLKKHISENISDPEFSVKSLATSMAQSQSSLLKKTKMLTGSNVAEMIKEIRLQEAAQLLTQKGDIASVAYAVGFSDRKYFSKEFKKRFGLSPTEFQEKT